MGTDSLAVRTKDALIQGPGDFARAAAYEAIQVPFNGLRQIANVATPISVPELQIINKPQGNSYWVQGGRLLGGAFDYFMVSKGVGSALTAGGLSRAALTRPIIENGISGFLFEGTHPLEESQTNFPWSKLSNMAISGATFAAIGGTSQIVDRIGIFGRVGLRNLAESVIAEGCAGAAGGGVNAELTALRKHGRLAELPEIANGSCEYGLFGATMGGLGHFFGPGRPDLLHGKGVGSAMSTEQFLLEHYDAGSPIDSPILNYIAENNPKLRPPNYEQWKASRSLNEEPRFQDLDIGAWPVEQRPQLVQELRRLAKTSLASDKNLDAFITTLHDSKWSQQGLPYKPYEIEKACYEWLRADKAMEMEFRRHPEFGKDIQVAIANQELLNANPQFKSLVESATEKRLAFRELESMKDSFDDKALRQDMEDVLNRLSDQRGLRHLEFFKFDMIDGSYAPPRRMFIGDSTLSPGLTQRSASVLLHEFVHHEQGCYSSRLIPFRIQKFMGTLPIMEYMTKVRQQSDLTGWIEKLSDSDGVLKLTQDIALRSEYWKALSGKRCLPADVESIISRVSQDAVPVTHLGGSESSTKVVLHEFLNQTMTELKKSSDYSYRQYVAHLFERQAHAAQVLAEIRTRILHLPEHPVDPPISRIKWWPSVT